MIIQSRSKKRLDEIRPLLHAKLKESGFYSRINKLGKKARMAGIKKYWTNYMLKHKTND